MKSLAAHTRKTSPTDVGLQLGRLYSSLQGMMGSVKHKYRWHVGVKIIVNCQNYANGDNNAVSFMMGFCIAIEET